MPRYHVENKGKNKDHQTSATKSKITVFDPRQALGARNLVTNRQHAPPTTSRITARVGLSSHQKMSMPVSRMTVDKAVKEKVRRDMQHIIEGDRVRSPSDHRSDPPDSPSILHRAWGATMSRAHRLHRHSAEKHASVERSADTVTVPSRTSAGSREKTRSKEKIIRSTADSKSRERRSLNDSRTSVISHRSKNSHNLLNVPPRRNVTTLSLNQIVQIGDGTTSTMRCTDESSRTLRDRAVVVTDPRALLGHCKRMSSYIPSIAKRHGRAKGEQVTNDFCRLFRANNQEEDLAEMFVFVTLSLIFRNTSIMAISTTNHSSITRLLGGRRLPPQSAANVTRPIASFVNIAPSGSSLATLTFMRTTEFSTNQQSSPLNRITTSTPMVPKVHPNLFADEGFDRSLSSTASSLDDGGHLERLFADADGQRTRRIDAINRTMVNSQQRFPTKKHFNLGRTPSPLKSFIEFGDIAGRSQSPDVAGDHGDKYVFPGAEHFPRPEGHNSHSSMAFTSSSTGSLLMSSSIGGDFERSSGSDVAQMMREAETSREEERQARRRLFTVANESKPVYNLRDMIPSSSSSDEGAQAAHDRSHVLSGFSSPKRKRRRR